MVQFSASSNEAFATRLKSAAKNAGVAEWGLGARLASIAGVTAKAASKWLNAEAIPRRETLVTIADAFKVTPEWLLYGTHPMTASSPIARSPGDRNQLQSDNSNTEEAPASYRRTRSYPLISWIAAGNWAEACDNYQPGDGEEMIESSANAGDCGYWLTVRGDSMVRKSGFSFYEGTRILVQPEGFELVSGKLYIAKLVDTGETTFKCYVRDAGIEYLKPYNEQYQHIRIDENVRIIGRVVDAKAPPSEF